MRRVRPDVAGLGGGRRRWRAAARQLRLGGALLLLAALVGGDAVRDETYRYFAVGAPERAVAIRQGPARPSFVLMGGGADVDEAFRWMIRKAGVRPGSGGRFVVLRASGTGAYDPYVFFSGPARRTTAPVAQRWVGGAALGLSSAETLVIPSRAAADSPFVNSVVARANAVFIAGGDQSNYIRHWKGTRLESTLNSLLARKVPIGGTSAGLAILGAFDFAALRGTINSARALADPFDRRITLDPGPLAPDAGLLPASALANTITDSHFVRRDRMGRLVTFVARLVAPEPGGGCPGGLLPAAGGGGGAYPRGIGVSEQAALLVQGNRSGAHFTARKVQNPWLAADAAVYFVRPLAAPTRCAPGTPLTVRQVEIRKLADSATVFDLTDWSGADGYLVNIESGEFDVSPY